MKVTIVVGSVRKGANGPKIASWVKERVEALGHNAELLVLKDFDLPMLDTEQLPSLAKGNYPYEAVTAWSQAVSGAQSLILVTPEYNHSIPGALKNAIDWLWSEWADKPTGIVSYSTGPVGGARATVQLREVMGYVGSRLTRNDVSIGRVNANGVPPDAQEGIAKALEAQIKQLSALLPEAQ